LGLPEPRYLHHPLVVHSMTGAAWRKRDLAPTLEALRGSGVDGGELARQLATGALPSGFRLGDA
jgi:glutamyl-Q tRNA(Asp) synthetase